MSKKEKLLKRFLSKPADFEFNELVILLKMFDFELISGGKTSGSACKFRHKNGECIFIHKPHPNFKILSNKFNYKIFKGDEFNMKDILEYKGYQGTVEFSKDDSCLYGKVIGIKSLIIYEGQTVKELIENFHNFVDEYLETCKKNKTVPEKPFKGNFNVRIDPELHKKAVIIANKQGISLNKFIEHAVRNMIAI